MKIVVKRLYHENFHNNTRYLGIRINSWAVRIPYWFWAWPEPKATRQLKQ